MFRRYAKFFIFILLGCLWSGSFIGIKAVVDAWPAFFGASIRASIALVAIIFSKAWLGPQHKINLVLRWKLLFIGIFTQGIPFAFLFWGERFISPGLAGILNVTTPIWTYVFTLFLPNKTTCSWLKTLGLLVSILGVIDIFYPHVSFQSDLTFLYGTAAVLFMAMSYAAGGLFSQFILQENKFVNFYTNLYYQHWGSFLFLWLLVIISNSYPTQVSLEHSALPFVTSLYLGIGSTAIAYSLYYYLIREWDALRASTVLYLIPGLTLFWDYLFYRNIPRLNELIGVLAILCGIGMIQVKNLQKQNQRLFKHP